MTAVYIDVAALSMEPGGNGGSVRPVEPEAMRALRYLADAVIRVVIVAGGGSQPSLQLEAVAAEVVNTVPARPRALAWYLTSDIERCREASTWMRTVLIGATPPSGSVRRCDAVARDVQAAVMEILAAVAMPQRTDER